jgi:hypothetical protein
MGDVESGLPESTRVPRPGGDRRQVALACAAVVVAIAIAHGGSLRNEFVDLDDDIYVYRNPLVQGGLTADSVRAAFSVDSPETYFHPLTWLSLMANRELLGPAPWGFHLVNVLLHAVAAVTLLLVLVRATGRPWLAALAAGLFAVHPLTVEAVAWAAERKTVLSTALGMLAILAYLSHSAKPAWWRLAPVGALLAASMLAKPGLVVLPGLLLIADVWPLRRLRLWATPVATEADPFPRCGPGRLLAEKLLLGLVALAALAPAIRSTVGLSKLTAPLEVRLANALAALPSYLGAVFWPVDLGPYHLYRAFVRVGPTLGGAALLLGLLVAAVLTARRLPAVAFGICWFLVALLPYLGIRQTGLWPAWADRFAYVPLMGVAVALVYGGEALVAGRRRAGRVLLAIAGAAAVALVVATRVQVTQWSDSVTFFERAVRIEPGATLMRFNLGMALVAKARYAEAVQVLDRAIAQSPYNGWGNAMMGVAKAGLGRDMEAEAWFLQALRLDPNAVEALCGLGELYTRAGQPARAATFYARLAVAAARSRPDLRELALRRMREGAGGP